MEIEAFGADQATIDAVTKSARQILTRDETITAIAVQQKLAGFKPDAIVLTNRRCIAYRPGLLKVSFEDALWRDVENVHLDEGILSAKILVRLVNKRQVTIERLSKEHARRIYALAQEKEQEAAEIRRQRTLEEERARAGGIIMSTGPTPPMVGAPGQTSGTMAKLGELRALLDAGLITEDEYNQKKAQILAQM